METRMGTKEEDRTPLTHTIMYPSDWIEEGKKKLMFARDNRRSCENENWEIKIMHEKEKHRKLGL